MRNYLLLFTSLVILYSFKCDNSTNVESLCKDYIRNYKPVSGKDEFGQKSMYFPEISKELKAYLELDTVDFELIKYSIMLYHAHCVSIKEYNGIDYMLFTKRIQSNAFIKLSAKYLSQKYDEDIYDSPKGFCGVYGLFISNYTNYNKFIGEFNELISVK
jgi:hypothetical protein